MKKKTKRAKRITRVKRKYVRRNALTEQEITLTLRAIDTTLDALRDDLLDSAMTSTEHNDVRAEYIALESAQVKLNAQREKSSA